MEKCAQSVLQLSLFFALEIWTIRHEPLVSGSSCSLFGVGAMFGSTQDTVLRLRDGFWKYFMIFYVIGWTRLLRSILLC